MSFAAALAALIFLLSRVGIAYRIDLGMQGVSNMLSVNKTESEMRSQLGTSGCRSTGGKKRDVNTVSFEAGDYHTCDEDNTVFKVKFWKNPSVKFSIKRCMVTKGESIGNRVKHGNDGGDAEEWLSFGASRQKSEGVANTWNNLLGEDQMVGCLSTSSTPSELNFLFVGELKVRLGYQDTREWGNITSATEHTQRITNFYIAQGSGVLRNNWWIGSRDCKKSGFTGGRLRCGNLEFVTSGANTFVVNSLC